MVFAFEDSNQIEFITVIFIFYRFDSILFEPESEIIGLESYLNSTIELELELEPFGPNFEL
jgi:hypothetical protein